ncbi:hypothetical protein EGR_09459 [Echinococcus granulosus]|uniref:Uncharacterized protein n=1 Tax=Echinococcus granulosus TaxID=6210 RepID=W6UQJ6_ECHGR|nr:hypothetical protein EGR_09459 [Echinococcus granulosus]EUB55699.1 hypothetical protein EGR_09459 [Echinococcus granulosus]
MDAKWEEEKGANVTETSDHAIAKKYPEKIENKEGRRDDEEGRKAVGKTLTYNEGVHSESRYSSVADPTEKNGGDVPFGGTIVQGAATA